jgi:hypothetical protein
MRFALKLHSSGDVNTLGGPGSRTSALIPRWVDGAYKVKEESLKAQNAVSTPSACKPRHCCHVGLD